MRGYGSTHEQMEQMAGQVVHDAVQSRSYDFSSSHHPAACRYCLGGALCRQPLSPHAPTMASFPGTSREKRQPLHLRRREPVDQTGPHHSCPALRSRDSCTRGARTLGADRGHSAGRRQVHDVTRQEARRFGARTSSVGNRRQGAAQAKDGEWQRGEAVHGLLREPLNLDQAGALALFVRVAGGAGRGQTTGRRCASRTAKI